MVQEQMLRHIRPPTTATNFNLMIMKVSLYKTNPSICSFMKGIVLVKQKYRIGFSVSKQKESPVKET
jgi:hypothetical protein